MKYGIIFWGNSSDSKKVFTLQKKIVRVMIGVKSRNSCRDLFKRLQILTLPCGYIYPLINFIKNNEEHFQTNADVHSVNTRHKHCLHKPIANLSCFQKSAYYAGISIFNNLPSNLKGLTYLLTHGAEPFWRNRQFCSYSRISQHFMEPEGSLPCSQEPSTGLMNEKP